MKRRHYVSIISFVVAAGLLGAGALVVVGQSKVPPQAIASSVTRTPELVERAWRCRWRPRSTDKSAGNQMGRVAGPPPLPTRIGRLGTRQAQRARCLPARAGAGPACASLALRWTSWPDVARANTSRKITVLRDLSEEQFREHLRRSNDPGRRYIVNFSRAANIWRRRRTSFADWRLSRSRGPRVRP